MPGNLLPNRCRCGVSAAAVLPDGYSHSAYLVKKRLIYPERSTWSGCDVLAAETRLLSLAG